MWIDEEYDAQIVKELNEMTEEQRSLKIYKSPWFLACIHNPNERFLLSCVCRNGLCIEYIKNPSPKIQLAAVRENFWAIQCIENPTEEAQIEAVRRDSMIIKYIKDPTEKVKIIALQNDWRAIQYIENPSTEGLEMLYITLKKYLKEENE